MDQELKIGVHGIGILHGDQQMPDIDTRFRMAKEAGFDYIERSPPQWPTMAPVPNIRSSRTMLPARSGFALNGARSAPPRRNASLAGSARCAFDLREFSHVRGIGEHLAQQNAQRFLFGGGE